MNFAQALQYCLAGITTGSIYAVIGIGFNIIYNTTGIINFAQGEFLILGAMLAISFAGVMPLFPAIILAILITAVIGALIEFIFIRWIKRPSVLGLIIVTIGISILLRELMLHLWDEKVRALPFFTGNEISSIRILGAYISPQVLWVLGLCTVVVVALSLFFKFTLIGRAMRACAANRNSARLCGINARWMVSLSFMLSAGIGALAGCLISPLTQTQYNMGTSLAIKGFTVAVLGGLGNSMAAVMAGLLLGLLEAFSISLLPLAYKDAISIAVLLIILFFKPSGILGSREASALQEFSIDCTQALDLQRSMAPGNLTAAFAGYVPTNADWVYTEEQQQVEIELLFTQNHTAGSSLVETLLAEYEAGTRRSWEVFLVHPEVQAGGDGAYFGVKASIYSATPVSWNEENDGFGERYVRVRYRAGWNTTDNMGWHFAVGSTFTTALGG